MVVKLLVVELVVVELVVVKLLVVELVVPGRPLGLFPASTVAPTVRPQFFHGWPNGRPWAALKPGGGGGPAIVAPGFSSSV